MANHTFVLKRGEVGKVLTFTLSEADGLVDLTSATVTMNLQRNGTIIVDDAACTNLDQTSYKGQCKHTFNSTTANIGVGNYLGNLKVVSPSSTLFWPVNKNAERTYFTVIVQEPID